MRGFPPIQIFLLCLTFVVLAVPLSHLTGTVSHAKAAPVKVEESPSVKSLVRLRYAHKPVTLSVKIADKELIAEIGGSPIELQTTLPSPNDGVDVFVKASWAEGTPDTSITLELEPDGLATRSATRWSSSESLDEVITFEWK
ncbi:MAG: hypothetical protein K9N47_02720 [Prosthecobacter sp.]|uniref:hypothetical protein n=1 Tax=Prosthecobacter sp. TaxID=1965333 RepID=UPI0025DE3ADB|nr:hypothetical protein [Prosthecobacter sp.]MCF7785003.1 hypothetical protein [Prosthecobacter sp.]